MCLENYGVGIEPQVDKSEEGLFGLVHFLATNDTFKGQ